MGKRISGLAQCPLSPHKLVTLFFSLKLGIRGCLAHRNGSDWVVRHGSEQPYYEPASSSLQSFKHLVSKIESQVR